MQKIILKFYIKGKIFPLFKCEIVDEPEETLKKLEDKLNDKNLEVVSFGQVCFKRDDFRYYEIDYK